MGKDVPFHGVEKLLPGRAARQVQRPVQGVKRKAVVVYLTGRRTGTAVTNHVKVALSFYSPVLDPFRSGDAFTEIADISFEVEQYPVGEYAGGGIRVVDDEGK